MEIEMDTGDIHNNEFAIAYLKSVSNIFEATSQEETERARVYAATQAFSEKRKSLGFGRIRRDGDNISNKSGGADNTIYYSAQGMLE